MLKRSVCLAAVCLLVARPEALRAQGTVPATAPAPDTTSARQPARGRAGWDDVGNGDRLFFLPTARNLRRGEGYVQDLELVFVSANYGITDHFSVGALASVIPGQGADNIIALTPKASWPVAEKVHLGAGALLIATKSGAGAVTYANGTYGSADNNLTLGLGYGFTDNSGFISTPVLVLGGAVRVARRVSLMSETYVLRDRSFLDLGTFLVVGGIAGVRVTGPRFSGGLGVLYAYGEIQSSDFLNGSGSLAYPFGEFTVRFGKIKR